MTLIWQLTAPALVGPWNERFAYGVRTGTWSPQKARPCRACGASGQRRVQPLVLELRDDWDELGDFLWASWGSDVAVSARVVEAASSCAGLRFERVEIRSPGASTPPFFEPLLSHGVRVAESPGVATTTSCSDCGARAYEIPDLDRMPISIGGMKAGAESNEGFEGALRIPRDALDGHHLFRLQEFPLLYCCTSRVKLAIEEAEFTNVAFRALGRIR